MPNEITSRVIVGNQVTTLVGHDTANPSTSFVVCPIVTDQFHRLTGLSVVPSASGTLSFYSITAGNVETLLWTTPLVSNQRLDFAGEFIFGAIGSSIGIRSTIVLGSLTLTSKTSY